MKLVIAEKPSVAKAIYNVLGATNKHNGYYTGNGYVVSWCYGHLVSLCLPNEYNDKWAEKWSFQQLPMLPQTWKFKISKASKEQFEILKTLLNDNRIDEVICATDADREGECIFRYVYNLAVCRKPVKRLWISSLEESAIKNGFTMLKSGTEYDNLFKAGFCRAQADWLVGMNGSRLFSVKYNTQLNIGRVQTPTLAMIVKRDYDVANFIKQKYYTAELDCGEFTASTEKIIELTAVNEIINKCNGKSAIVTEIKKELKTINPPKLYDLTTLQREANKQYGYTAQQTLEYIQALYEAKLVTYPRTDSQYLSDDMEQSTLNIIHNIKQAMPGAIKEPNIKHCINNSKVTGHHAIIPTSNFDITNINTLSAEHKNIVMLIVLRLMCAVAEPHKYESTQIIFTCENIIFTAKGTAIINNGWKLIENTDKEKNIQLPNVKKGAIYNNVTVTKAEHWTSPPKTFTEDTLLSAMEHAGQENYTDDTEEKKGLGTPATRAEIIENLVQHGYAQRTGKKITATLKGINLIGVVPDEIKSPILTAQWEMKLQDIEKGKYDDSAFITDITNYIVTLCNQYSNTENNTVSFNVQAQSIGHCPLCHNEVKRGKYGFYCTGKCGMNMAKVYGKELTEAQLKNLLNGKKISYTSNGKKTIVFPEIVENTYNGRTNYQWKTKC